MYCWPLSFSTREYWPGKHSAVILSPGPLLSSLRWIHFPSGASSLPFLATILKGRVCIPEAYTPQSHGVGNRWPTVCCETRESKFKKKKFCHGFGMLCFSDENTVFRVGLWKRDFSSSLHWSLLLFKGLLRSGWRHGLQIEVHRVSHVELLAMHPPEAPAEVRASHWLLDTWEEKSPLSFLKEICSQQEVILSECGMFSDWCKEVPSFRHFVLTSPLHVVTLLKPLMIHLYSQVPKGWLCCASLTVSSYFWNISHQNLWKSKRPRNRSMVSSFPPCNDHSFLS